MYWHYNLGKKKRNHFLFPIIQRIRYEMNAMDDEAQQAVDLIQHTGFHRNQRVSPSPDTDINDLNERILT